MEGVLHFPGIGGNVGAGILHRFVNRQNAAPAVALFKPGPSGAVPKTPNEAVEQDATHWKGFWQAPDAGLQADSVLKEMRARVFNGLSLESQPNVSDMPRFSASMLFGSARTCKKVSKGSDNWLASEFLLLLPVLDPLAQATDDAVVLVSCMATPDFA